MKQLSRCFILSTLLTVSALAVPEIAVEQPSGTNLTDGSSTVDFGSLALSGSRDLTFTVLNTGNTDLTGLPITIDGAHASDFSVTASPVAPVPNSGSTVFTVRFAPGAPGPRSAALHLANNDGDENPFDINLTGQGLTPLQIAQQAYLKASNTEPQGDVETGDEFGASVAVSGHTVVVAAPWEASSATGVNGPQNDNRAFASGAVYVFVLSGTTWSQQAYLKASNTDEGDFFGWSVAISGDTLVVGARDESSSATGVNGNQSDNNADFSGAAYVFVRSSTTWTQQAYLKASNTEEFDGFGNSVAVSGNTVVVGATGEDSNATGVNGNQSDNSASSSGAAYVFVRSGTTWAQQAYLKASNSGEFDDFGQSVAVSGDTVVVGAYGESSNATGVNGNQSDNSAERSGAAYVFVRSGTTWAQQAYLKASDTEPADHDGGDGFGFSVAVSGDTVVVGAPGEDSNATGVNGDPKDNSARNSGAVSVFVRNGDSWTQQAYVKASNTETFDSFGNSVAVSGDSVLVGAAGEDSIASGINGNQSDNSADSSGAGYLFVRSGTTWSQQAYLKASNSGEPDSFGDSVAMSEDKVVVGAPGEASNATGVNGNQSNNSSPLAGAAYVFETVTGDPILAPGDTMWGGIQDQSGEFFEVGTVGTASGVNNWPAGEPPSDLINQLKGGAAEKYLNFAAMNTGIIVTPAAGPSIITSMSLSVADDAEERDPASYALYGTNSPITGPGPFDLGPLGFVLISSGPLALPSSRDTITDGAGNDLIVPIPAKNRYTSYMLIFPTVKNPQVANSMQLSELQFYGSIFAPPTPEIAVEQPAGTNLVDGSATVSFGDVLLGNNVARTFTIRNTGDANLTGLGITINGPNASDFRVTANPTAPVPGPEGTTTFTVTFT
ncbi:MAG: choice-of-anchor D domain-containing protein, partial [Verrucomicrobiales bacterium]